MAEENGLELGEELGRIVPAKQKEAATAQAEEEQVHQTFLSSFFFFFFMMLVSLLGSFYSP